LCSYCAANNAIAFLLDISKSIPDKDFEKAKEQIQTIASQDTSSTISVYTFGSELNKVEIGDLAGIKPTESYTMLYDAVYDVAQALAKTDSDKKAIFIVSDGDDTRSVTVLEDAVSFANNNGISVYGIGLGKVNHKSMERIAKLTGGEYFPITSDDLPGRIQSGLQMQKSVPKKEAVTPAPAPVTPPPAPVAQTKPPASLPPDLPMKRSMPYLWIGGGI